MKKILDKNKQHNAKTEYRILPVSEKTRPKINVPETMDNLYNTSDKLK
jgi:hypothetical protein